MPRSLALAKLPRPTGSGVPLPGWADKTDVILVRKSAWLRSPFRRLMLALLLAAVAAGAVGPLFLRR